MIYQGNAGAARGLFIKQIKMFIKHPKMFIKLSLDEDCDRAKAETNVY